MKTFASILIVTAITIAAASAQPGRGDRPEGKGERGGPARPNAERLAEKLELTAEQSSQLQELRYQFQSETVELRANLQKNRLEVQRLLGQDHVDEAAVMKAIEAEAAAQLAMRKVSVAHQLKVRAIVGPEKAEQLAEMRNEWRDRRPGPGSSDRDDRGPREQRGPKGNR